MKQTKPVAAPSAIDPSRILARDVMQTDVLVLRADDPIKSAAEQLEEFSISGAPVVDAGGRLVGVLTQSDLARSEHVTEVGVTARPARSADDLEAVADEADEDVDEEVFPTEDYDEALLGRLRVADWMSPGVIEESPDATLAKVCRRMLDEGIHRVFIVDRERLVGVVSTEDVVRLLAAPGHAGARQAAKPGRRR